MNDQESSKQSRVFGSVGSNLFNFKDATVSVEEKSTSMNDKKSNDNTDEKNINFQTLDFQTGEESETSIIKLRCKLYCLNGETKQWLDKGVGEIKINHDPEQMEQSRISIKMHYYLVFRLEGSLKLLLNNRVIKKMPPIKVDLKTVRFCIIDQDRTLLHYLARFASEIEALDFCDALTSISSDEN